MIMVGVPHMNLVAIAEIIALIEFGSLRSIKNRTFFNPPIVDNINFDSFKVRGLS